MERLRQLVEKRNRAINEAREILDGADKDKRNLSEEERGKYDEIIGDAESLLAEIDREKKQIELERSIGSDSAILEREGNPSREPSKESKDEERDAAQMAAYRGFLVGGQNAVSAEGRQLLHEERALSATSGSEGGFLVMPRKEAMRLIKAVDNLTFVRQHATVFPLDKAESLGTPSLENDPADADWTSEIGAASEDTAMSFGGRELKPSPFTKLLKASRTLLRRSSMPVEQIVRGRLAYKCAVTEEKAYLTGTGNDQPLGMFTASDVGIPTGRDVSTGNTTTALTFDGLKNAVGNQKEQYLAKSRWLFNRTVVTSISLLKDGEGRYLWQPSQIAGEPDTILSYPVHRSEYAPNTMTTGLYVGLFGDFSHYWIADSLQILIQVLTELYALTNQNGYIVRKETDGMPVQSEAFTRLKLA